jgi:SOS-response transcriptional repressor LexA
MVVTILQDGNMILVSPQAKADDGAIVVAMVDGVHTVKRLYRKGNGIHLVPSHSAVEPLSIRKDAELRIIVKAVAVLRFLEPAFSSYPLAGIHYESWSDPRRHRRADNPRG